MNHAHIHPVMAAVLQSAIECAPRAARLQRDIYIDLLRRHDWTFQYSDDHNTWNAGNRSLRDLNLLRRELDPDGAIWNSHAPAGYQFTPVAAKAAP